jgi:hypothetical protein
MVKRKRLKKCAYCGVHETDEVPFTRDHVIPKCLYPATRRDLNLIVVDACAPCNNGFSDDEVHFRTMVALAGESNSVVKELWNTKIVRSFDEKDGLRRVRQVLKHTAKVQLEGKDRLIIFPGQDVRVVRIIKKIVRGLSHFHEIDSAVDEKRIHVAIHDSELSEGTLEPDDFSRSYPGIVRYFYKKDATTDSKPVWILTFFDRLTFVALVGNPKTRPNTLTIPGKSSTVRSKKPTKVVEIQALKRH